MKRLSLTLAIGAVAALLAGCGGGSSNGGAVPSITQTSLTANKLQVAVGTAYNAADGTTGLNVVATFRQSGGGSAVLADTPSLTGPATFTLPANFPGAYTTNSDAGTHTISASPQVNLSVTPAQTTLGTFTGVFSYGFAPLNSDQQGAAGYYPGNPNATPGNGFSSSNYYFRGAPWWAQPFGAAAAAQGVYLIGPPAVPFFNDGTFPANFAGYSPGFTLFEAPPAVGTYTLNVNVAAANAASQSFTATSNNLATVTPLAAPVVSGVADTAGGLTGTVTINAGTETLVFVHDTTNGHFYTVGPISGAGAQTFTVPPNLGACNGNGCQNTTPLPAAQTSFATGDAYVVTAISFDYPAFEDAPPGNTSQTPALTGAAGQTDLTIGVPVAGTY